jgi:hypothetical protein
MWTGDWQIQTTQTITTKGQEVTATALDEEGWFYAFDWPTEFRPEAKNFYSYVRKRKWQRTRRKFTAVEFFERAVKLGCSKEAVHDACMSPGCISPAREINFGVVLSALGMSATKGGTGSEPHLADSEKLSSADDILRKAAQVAVNDRIKNNDSHLLLMETLAKSCRMKNLCYDIILNARMTVFFKHFSNVPPPARQKKAMCSGSAEEECPLWYLVDNGKNNVVPSLSPRGVDVFRGLFTELSCTKLIFDDDEAASQSYIPHIIKLVMENHHELCGCALTVLRRELSKCG